MYFVSCFSFPIGGRLLTLLCREILLHEPFKFKLRSAEEREAWEKSADNFKRNWRSKVQGNSEIGSRSIYLFWKKSTQL